ncbi:hypothetical protein JNW89_19150, partial [Micromonospora sp. 4G55]|nr:hypothetical protein [Micromonospora sp. 4G55]
PRGAGFAAGFLPLALTSMLVGVLLTVLVAGRRARLVGLSATPCSPRWSAPPCCTAGSG